MQTCCPHEPPPDRPPLAEGRYCLAVCYCGLCPHYEPLPAVRRYIPPARRDESWR